MTTTLAPQGAAAASTDIKIRIRELSKVFQTKTGPFVALDDINLDIPVGCFFMIVGPSGCGKTTLLRILAGLEEHSSGSLEVSSPAANRPGNSMVFQGDSLFPWMTVWENAAYGLNMRGVPKGEVKSVVGHYLSRTGLSRFHDYYPHQLSGGMRQRVSIARAFANDPGQAMANVNQNQTTRGGDITNGAQPPSITPASLEGSNVSAVDALVRLMDYNRSFESNIRMIKEAKATDESGTSMMRAPS